MASEGGRARSSRSFSRRRGASGRAERMAVARRGGALGGVGAGGRGRSRARRRMARG